MSRKTQGKETITKDRLVMSLDAIELQLARIYERIANANAASNVIGGNNKDRANANVWFIKRQFAQLDRLINQLSTLNELQLESENV